MYSFGQEVGRGAGAEREAGVPHPRCLAQPSSGRVVGGGGRGETGKRRRKNEEKKKKRKIRNM